MNQQSPCQLLVSCCLLLLLALFLWPQPSDAFPALRHHHRRHHAIPTAEEANNGDSPSTAETPKLAQRMRINTGQWTWMESHSVREEVYVFAFTYFGMVTLLMVCLLVLVSCCYMYDCLGCYDPFWQKNQQENKGNNIFPVGDGQTVVLGQGAKVPKNWSTTAKGNKHVSKFERRWSML